MNAQRIFGASGAVAVLAPLLVLAAASTTIAGCLADPSSPLPARLRDSGVDATPAPTATTPFDAAPPPDAEPRPDGAVSLVGAGVGPGGTVARSQNYTLITKTGGAPGDGRPGDSQTYRLFSGLTAATKK